MNGMGYVPVCSSSSMSKTYRKSHFTGLLRLFLVYIINFYLKKRKIAVIPKQFNVSKVKLFFVCILVWRNYR